MRLLLTACLSLALTATLARAQAPETTMQLVPPPASAESTTVVPVWNTESGRVEALLLLEPGTRSPLERVIGLDEPQPSLGFGTRVRTDAGRSVQASLKLEPQGGLALLCDPQGGLMNTLGALAQHCLLGSLDANADPLGPYRPGVRAEARYDLPGGRLEFSLGLDQYDFGTMLPPPAQAGGVRYAPVQAWQPAPGLSFLGSRLERQGLGIGAQFAMGDNGWVAIGGTVARARLIPAGEALAPMQWDSAELSLGAGYGPFSGAITSRVVDTAGREGSWGGLDVGFTWRTPWRARLTVGARNLVTRGKDPWGFPEGEGSEATGRVPYVRYQQDL